MSCEYCRGEKPLTDKVYDDGSKFDDLHGTSIEYIGKVPIIVSYIKPKYFKIFKGLIKNMTDEQVHLLCCRWAVTINECPICGKPLTEPKPLTLDELKERDGKPVYCVGIGNKALTGWGLVDWQRQIIRDGVGDFWDLSEFNITYNVYDREPKEESDVEN